MIPFAQYCSRVEEHIERVYGVRVVTRDVPDPLTGDLDGAEIHIDHAVNPEERLFLLAHLFGHTVQWNVDPEAFALGLLRPPQLAEKDLPALAEYEREAACYALSLFHEIGITGLDQWLSDFSACDVAYLTHYYRTRTKKHFMSFWQDGTPCIQPRKIPPFQPAKRRFRTDGIVI